MRFWIMFLMIMLPNLVFAETLTHLRSLRIQPSETASIITFYLDQKTYGHVKYQPKQNRLLIEFANTINQFTMQNARINHANITAINSVATANNTLQFYLTLKNEIRWTMQFVAKEDGIAQLQLRVISLATHEVDRQVSLGKKLKINIDETLADLSAHIHKQEKFTEQSAKKARIFTVVIDAGHGGKDTGAIGANGTKEKNVVLAIAKKLTLAINQEPNMRAIMTRTTDVFLPLRARMNIARKQKADLFIAIHADAYFEKNAKGASVYALSQHGATSEAARWLAARDNYSELGGVELNDLSDRSIMLRSVLIDLAQTATITDSIRFGSKVLNALDDISTLHYKHVEQAPFMVLKSPDIPSVLVETGFITNPDEEQRLADGIYQEKLANALLIGIQKYTKSYSSFAANTFTVSKASEILF